MRGDRGRRVAEQPDHRCGDPEAVRDGICCEKKLAVQCEKLAASIARVSSTREPPWAEEQSPRKAQFAMFWQSTSTGSGRERSRSGSAGSSRCCSWLSGSSAWCATLASDMDSFVYFATFLATITVLLIFYSELQVRIQYIR